MKFRKLKAFIKKAAAGAVGLAVAAGALPVTDLGTNALAENAAGPTMEQIETAAKLNSGFYGMAKVVNGDLYVWGKNTKYALGITSYYDSDRDETVTVGADTVVPTPVKMPDGTFDGKVIAISTSWDTINIALTDQGSIYGWSSVKYLPDSSIDQSVNGTVPKKIDTSAAVGKIIKITMSNRHFFAEDEYGNWYSAGSGWTAGFNGVPNGDNSNLQKSGEYAFAPIGSEYLDALGYEDDGVTKRTIKDIVSDSCHATAIICTDGTMFMAGANWDNAMGFAGEQHKALGYGEVYNLSEAIGNEQNNGVPVKFVNASANDTAFSAVDTDGNVWGWGCNHYQYFGKYTDEQVVCDHKHRKTATPVKVYSSSVYGSKAMVSYLTSNNLFFITNNNSVYGLGANSNGMLDAAQETTAEIYNPTQIFAEQSTECTIVGLCPTTTSVTIYTSKSDSYFVGDNSNGSAGNGTTTSLAAGTVDEVIYSSVVPDKPYTANEIIFELQVERDNGTFRYRAAPTDAYPKRVQKTDSAGNVTYLNNGMLKDEGEAIPAGKTFKLNVYFNDFGKLHTFLVPIRFNPSYVKVVNGSGTAFSDTAIVNGGIGADGAVEKLFTSENWTGGTLAQGGTNQTYPKVCNGEGWVSVMGYTTTYKAGITGEQAMFSIKFQAVGTSGANLTMFDIADTTNAISGKTDISGEGVDLAGSAEFKYGAYWSINNPNSESQIASYDFNETGYAQFQTTVTDMTKLALKLYYSDGTEVEETTEVNGVDNPDAGARAINNKNSDMVYTLKVAPTPTDSSFPQVDWTTSLLLPNDTEAVSLTDYITIIETADTYIKFKLSDNFSQTATGEVQFAAQSRKYPSLTSSMPVYICSFEAPEFVQITEKNYSSVAADASASKEEFVYHDQIEWIPLDEADEESRQFTVTFPEDNTANTKVTWTLYDQDGNELDPSAADCPVRIVSTTPATSTDKASVTIEPLRTTLGDTYVTLKVASVYDPLVYDTATIKVQFYANDMAFDRNVVYIAAGYSRDLSELLSIAPSDVYETNLEWSYPDPHTFGDDEDNQSYYISLSDDGVVTAYDTATPTEGFDDEKYEKIIVTDTVSGLSASVYVAVLDLNSPFGIEDVTVYNRLGDSNDTLTITQGLEVGDILHLYYSYGGDEWNQIGELNEVQAAALFPFPIAGLLDSGGGELAIAVSREVDGEWVDYDMVPVTYTAEPSKVYGYVGLAGRSDTSTAHAGIRVDLKGIGHEETVYTDANGRFEFTSYIKPGTYTLTISKNYYLTRVIQKNDSTGFAGLTIPSAEEFCIASKDSPIKLYAGDINGDKIINASDISVYVTSWVGMVDDGNVNEFNNMDFYDSSEYAAIGAEDLNLVLIHYSWTSGKYANWITPDQ